MSMPMGPNPPTPNAGITPLTNKPSPAVLYVNGQGQYLALAPGVRPPNGYGRVPQNQQPIVMAGYKPGTATAIVVHQPPAPPFGPKPPVQTWLQFTDPNGVVTPNFPPNEQIVVALPPGVK